MAAHNSQLVPPGQEAAASAQARSKVHRTFAVSRPCLIKRSVCGG